MTADVPPLPSNISASSSLARHHPTVENDTEPRSSAYTSASAGSIGSNSAAAAAAAAAKKECAEVGAYAATASDGIVLKTRGGKGGGENGIKPSSTACGDTAPGERCYEGSGGGQGLGYDIGVDADALGIGVAGSGASSELVTGSREAREQAVKKLSSASATYRRQQASAAVGACLVTSSVRKDGKVTYCHVFLFFFLGERLLMRGNRGEASLFFETGEDCKESE